MDCEQRSTYVLLEHLESLGVIGIDAADLQVVAALKGDVRAKAGGEHDTRLSWRDVVALGANRFLTAIALWTLSSCSVGGRDDDGRWGRIWRAAGVEHAQRGRHGWLRRHRWLHQHGRERRHGWRRRHGRSESLRAAVKASTIGGAHGVVINALALGNFHQTDTITLSVTWICRFHGGR